MFCDILGVISLFFDLSKELNNPWHCVKMKYTGDYGPQSCRPVKEIRDIRTVKQSVSCRFFPSLMVLIL